jgi:endonuclease/exonuclease/phosphatase family metal-dependent hydrolase/uncharacterized ParB-like nuclease family protein
VRLILFSTAFFLLSLLLNAQVRISGRTIDSFQTQKKIIIADTIRFSDEPLPQTLKTSPKKVVPKKAIDSTKIKKPILKVVDSTKVKKAVVPIKAKAIDSSKIKKPILKVVDSTKVKKAVVPTKAKAIDSTKIKKPILKVVDSTKVKKAVVPIKAKAIESTKIKKPILKVVDSTKVKKAVVPIKAKAVDSTKIKKLILKVIDSTKVKKAVVKIKTVDSLKVKKPIQKAFDSTKVKKAVVPTKAKAVDSTKIKKPILKVVDSTKVKKAVVPIKAKAIDSTKIKKPLLKVVDSTKVKKTKVGMDLQPSPKEPRILNPKIATDSAKIPKMAIFKREATQLKIISYNIKHGVGTDGKINLLKLVDLIKKYQPDIVALQEIDSGMVRSGKLFQARILSLLTGYDEIYGKAVETSEGNYGLAILTKHSYQDFQNIELPSPEATESRNMLSVVITLPNNRLIRFCNTQLDYKSPLNRGIQAALISKNLGFGLYPTVLCGNFNAAIDDHTVDFLPKYWNNAGRFDDSPTHIPTDRRIDYCWTTKGNDFTLCEYRVLKDVKISDHYPILVVYELSK